MKTVLRYSTLFWIFVSWFFVTVEALPSYLQFDRLTVENGLSSNFIHCIFQDKKGWIWFGTSQGLSRFDGVNFKAYKNNPGDSTSLIGDLVRFIYEDHLGQMWVGTENGGLNQYNREKDAFVLIPDFEGGIRQKNYHANTIAEAPNGALWIGTNSGLKVLDRKTLKFYTFQKKLIDNNSLCNNVVRKILFDSQGRLWVGTINGLDCFEPKTNIFKHVLSSIEENIDLEISALFKDSDGSVWVGTYQQSIFIYNSKTFNYRKLEPDPMNNLARAVRAIMCDKNGNYWIGTRNGVYIYSKSTGLISHFEHDERYAASLSHNSILSIFSDIKGDVWIGTREGVSYVNFQKQVFHHIKSFPDNNLYLNNGDVFCFWAKNNNEVWIGTDNGGVNILDRKSNTFRYLKKKPGVGGLTSNCIKAIVPDNNGRLWIATYLEGINVYNPQNGSNVVIKHRLNDTNSLIDNRVWSLMCDSKNQIWVGTETGVDRIDPKTGKITHCQSVFSSKQIDWIAEDSENDIWVSNNQGIIILNPNSNTTRNISTGCRTRAFFEDRYKNYWIGSQGRGLLLVDKNKGVLTSLDERSGLSSNSVYSIVSDNYGILWIGTANGLSRFDTKSRLFSSFLKDDGPRINQYNYGAAYKLPSGELAFGGYNGMVIFNPNEVRKNEFLPPVRFTDLKIYNQSVNVGALNSPLKQNIEITSKVDLPYKQNFITICYASLNYNAARKNQYAYKLEGFDEDWHYVGNKTEASYTNLQPGYYTFRVMGSNNDNKWNKEGAFLVIHVIPPFYKTWLFRIFLLVLIVGIIVLVVWARDQMIRKQNAELERLVNLRTGELQFTTQQLKESRFEIIRQKEEISGQNQSLVSLSEKIQLQNKELEKHTYILEEKVQERTLELVEAKLKAEESDKLKTAFLANISHEIRTPMNSIVGFSSLLSQETLSAEEKKEYTVNISKHCNSLLHLINDILDISLIEAGHFAANVSLFNVNLILSELHKSYELEKKWMEKPNVEFKLTVPNVQFFLSSDLTRIEQVMRNVLNNALKYTDKGIVELGYTKNQDEVVFFVKDTGIGIPEEKLEKIFERFVKLQDDPQRLFRGVGLGLSICQKIVENLGGRIWAKSKMGIGSTFFFSIPLVPHEK